MTILHTLWAIACVLAIATGQILFKFLGVEIQAGSSLFSAKVIIMALIAFSIYGGATILWIYLLRFVPLNKAYLFMSLSFVFVPLAGHFFLAEKITLGAIIGAIQIILGIFIASRFG
jgi:drug/metabolite transporter (DMT)-like permease